MRALIVIAGFVVFGLSPDARASETKPEVTVDQITEQNSMESPQVLQSRHFWVELDGQTDWGWLGRGAQLGAGYRMQYFGFDMRVSYGKTRYGAILVSPGYSQLPGDSASSLDADSELNRLRDPQDSWSYRMLEPGLSVSGKLFPRALPLLTEGGRVGFGYGSFHDNINDVSFTSTLFNLQASLACELGRGSPWSVTGALSWSTGILVANSPAGGSQQLRRLPVSWVGTSIGVQYSF